MTSQIVRTNPTAGTATTSSVRDNFGFAADEINRLLRANTDKVESTGTNEISAQFGNVPTFSLVDGVRVLIQIATTTTSETPTLNVNSTSNVPIKKSDNTDLAIGDLVAGGYYEFVYHSGNDYWLVLNLPSPFSSQNKLFEAMLGGLYPVGGLLTTTNSANPGDADYFFSGITFGTWEAYAAGRTIVGVDAGEGVASASAASDVVTINFNYKDTLSRTNNVVVTGFDNASANGTFEVTSAATVNGLSVITYDAPGAGTAANLTGTDIRVSNEAFHTSQFEAGETVHNLTAEEMAQHRHHQFVISSQSNQNYISGDSRFSSAYHFSRGGDDNRYIIARPVSDAYQNPTHAPSSNMIDARVGNGSGTDNDVTGDAPHNNLQPYITTYIWKRVVTP